MLRQLSFEQRQFLSKYNLDKSLLRILKDYANKQISKEQAKKEVRSLLQELREFLQKIAEFERKDLDIEYLIIDTDKLEYCQKLVDFLQDQKKQSKIYCLADKKLRKELSLEHEENNLVNLLQKLTTKFELKEKKGYFLSSNFSNLQVASSLKLEVIYIDFKNSNFNFQKDCWFLEAQKLQADYQSDFEIFYPTQLMTSAWEIFYAWIVRMVMNGMYFTGQIPFETYLCHPWVLDEQGRKMSKSLGNVFNPSEQIKKYSADAVRLAMLSQCLPGKNMRFQGKLADEITKKYRNFGNKLWNVARFFEYQMNTKTIQE